MPNEKYFQDPDDSSFPGLVEVSCKGFIDTIEYGLFVCYGGNDF
jgi:hypothetical protein